MINEVKLKEFLRSIMIWTNLSGKPNVHEMLLKELNDIFDNEKDRLWNRPDDERYGCDYCEESKPTEKFEGYCGNVLWICGECYKRLRIQSKDGGVR